MGFRTCFSSLARFSLRTSLSLMRPFWTPRWEEPYVQESCHSCTYGICAGARKHLVPLPADPKTPIWQSETNTSKKPAGKKSNAMRWGGGGARWDPKRPPDWCINMQKRKPGRMSAEPSPASLSYVRVAYTGGNARWPSVRQAIERFDHTPRRIHLGGFLAPMVCWFDPGSDRDLWRDSSSVHTHSSRIGGTEGRRLLPDLDSCRCREHS